MSSSTDGTSFVAEGDDRDVVDGEAVAPANPLLQVHALLRGRYWIAIVLAIVGGVAGAVVGYKLQKPMYTSTGMIHVKPYLPPVLDSNDQNGTMPFFESHMASQVSLILGRRLIDHAMQQKEWKELERGLEPEQVQKFTENLEAINPRGSEMLIVRFSDEDPNAARLAVKCVVDAYQELHGANSSESVESVVQILEGKRTPLLREQKEAADQIRALSNGVPFDVMNELYRDRLDELRKVKWRLQEAEMALEMAGDGAADARPAFKAMTAEELAMQMPQMGDLFKEKRVLERKIRSDRDRLGEKHQGVIAGEADLKLLTDEIDELTVKFNTMLAKGVGAAGAGTTREQLQAEKKRWQELYDREQAETDKLGDKCRRIDQLRADSELRKVKLQEYTDRIDQLRTARQVAGRITYVSRGDQPLAPAKDKRKAVAAAGALGLGGAGVGLVLLFGFLDRRIRHFDDVKTTAQSNRVLGVLPMLPSEDSDPEQAMIAAHGVHQIRMLLQGRIQSRKHSVIAITSASPGAGKTSLTMALGLSFAASGARTLLIDCDIIGGGLTSKMKRVTRRRTGCILRRLGLITTEQMVTAVRKSRRRGERIGDTLIRHGLVTRADIDHALQVQQESPVGLREALMGDPPDECITGGGSPNLFVMTLGSAQPQHVAQMSYPALHRLVEQVRGWFDIVLIDTGPILGSLEASVAAMVADDVVLAVARGEQRPLIDRAIQHLGSVGGRLAGIVLNRANADDILASNFSSSSSRASGSPDQQQGALKVRSIDHQCLQLGPIGRAVVAASDVEPATLLVPVAPTARPGDSTP